MAGCSRTPRSSPGATTFTPRSTAKSRIRLRRPGPRGKTRTDPRFPRARAGIPVLAICGGLAGERRLRRDPIQDIASAVPGPWATEARGAPPRATQCGSRRARYWRAFWAAAWRRSTVTTTVPRTGSAGRCGLARAPDGVVEALEGTEGAVVDRRPVASRADGPRTIRSTPALRPADPVGKSSVAEAESRKAEPAGDACGLRLIGGWRLLRRGCFGRGFLLSEQGSQASVPDSFIRPRAPARFADRLGRVGQKRAKGLRRLRRPRIFQDGAQGAQGGDAQLHRFGGIGADLLAGQTSAGVLIRESEAR